MVQFILVLTILLALTDWIAVAKNWRKVEIFAKPGTIAALLFAVGLNNGLNGPILWFTAGLIFCLVGDVLLLLPGDRLILAWGAFLVGHICFTTGFNAQGILINLPVLILGVFILAVDIQALRRLFSGCERCGRIEMKLPILAYTIIISLMLLSALSTLVRQEWYLGQAILVSAGAMLFFVSDLMLGYQRFEAEFRNSRVLIMITYHLGLFGILLGAANHYSM